MNKMRKLKDMPNKEIIKIGFVCELVKQLKDKKNIKNSRQKYIKKHK